MAADEFLPFDGKQLLLVAGAALAAILVFAALANPSGVEFRSTGENVSCGPPAIAPGDAYSYLASSGRETVRVEMSSGGFDAARRCRLLHQESSANASIDACFSEADGLLVYASSRGIEIPPESLAGQAPLVAFEPWMACAREGWTGGENFSRAMKPGILEVMRVRDVIGKRYSFAGAETVSGRRAYRIEEETFRASGPEGSTAETPVGARTIWVDAEKKVALEIRSTGASGLNATIAGAPFPLG
ncbi:MAG: hypothetical protein PHF51_00445 [Candidatus ainarchaeum sp.]|nr:hypothetical protein [Candidatus ainarchaeum sp.]